MRILIQSIPHKDQRYPTCGDWWTDPDGNLQIRVSEMADPKFMQLVAVHELIEALACKARNIDQLAVDKFDQGFNGPGEPGDDSKAPYYLQHQIATGVERIVAAHLGVKWLEYDATVDAL